MRIAFYFLTHVPIVLILKKSETKIFVSNGLNKKLSRNVNLPRLKKKRLKIQFLVFDFFKQDIKLKKYINQLD